LKGSVKVLVTFKVDEISMLIIRAKEKGINNEINNKFNFDKHRKKWTKNIHKANSYNKKENTNYKFKSNTNPPPVVGNNKRSQNEDIKSDCFIF